MLEIFTKAVKEQIEPQVIREARCKDKDDRVTHKAIRNASSY